MVLSAPFFSFSHHLPLQLQTWKIEKLTWSQSMYWWLQMQSEKLSPLPQPSQACGVRKSVCPVCIWPTDNFESNLMTSFRINELFFNKHNTRYSTINKRRLEKRTWSIFYINKFNELKWTIQINNNNLCQFNCSWINQE